MEGMGPHGGRADPILGASVFGGRTGAGVSGQGAINRDPGNPGRRVGLHRGRNRGTMRESWETTSPWPTSSRCGHARAPCISRTTRKREEDTWANAYRAPSGLLPR